MLKKVSHVLRLRKQPTFRDSTTGFFSVEMTSEERAQKFHNGDLSLPRSGGVSDWSYRKGNLLQPITSTT